MSEHLLVDSGEYGDLALGSDGQVYVCAETAQRDAIVVYRGAHGQQVIAFLDGAQIWEPENGGWRKRALYPRMAVNPGGDKAVCYQKGPAICLDLIGVKTIDRPAQEIPFGSEMVCVAWIGSALFWRLAYVAQIFGQIRLITRDYDREGHEIGTSMRATDTTQGVSRILPDGSVVLIDDDFRWPEYPNLSRPWQAGSLVVGQGNDAPARALGYLSGVRT